MNIFRIDDRNTLNKEAANLIADIIHATPACCLGLATGSSPIGLYSELAKMCAAGDLSFSDVKSYNLDEYVGLSGDHPQSYRYFMQDNLFKNIDIRPENIHIPSGAAADMDAECAAYSELLAGIDGGLDMQLLGIGVNGHIGFNEPDDHFTADTHVVDLSAETISSNARFFKSADEVPQQAVTMGVRPIMQAKSVILIATGENKAKALYGAVCGPITPQMPASILQLHRHVTVFADSAATSLIDASHN